MGEEYTEIDSKIRDWVGRQKMFFVATAPLAGEGLINCSPKGMDTFRILGPKTVAYLDLTGSGVETISHLKENGRIVIMMCALYGPPKIFRFYGRGRVFERGSPGYVAASPEFNEYVGARSIIQVELDRIIDSCGYAIPQFQYSGERDTLLKWSENKGEEGVVRYQQENNQASLDGLKGLE